MKLKNLLMSLVLGLTLITAQGCGSSISNIDPLTLFTDSSIPTLDSILPNSSVYTTLAVGFSSANPYWTFNTGSFYGTNCLAPASGYISDQGSASINGTTVNYVTILHSGRFATRIYGVSLSAVRPGDAVVRSQIIGSFISVGLGYVGFQVLLDGSPVCPLSYMSSSFRTLLSTTVFTQTAGTVCAP